MRDELDGIGSQVLVEGLPDKQQHGDQTEDEDRKLDPASREEALPMHVAAQ
jgi:hypothetical protein